MESQTKLTPRILRKAAQKKNWNFHTRPTLVDERMVIHHIDIFTDRSILYTFEFLAFVAQGTSYTKPIRRESFNTGRIDKGLMTKLRAEQTFLSLADPNHDRINW